MNQLSLRNVLAVILFAMFAVGCSTSEEQPMTDTSMSEATPATDDTVATGIGDANALTEEELAMQRQKEREMAMEEEMATLREVRVFYFDFDNSSIKPEARPYIKAHADFLQKNPSTNVVLNGYADERGTKEYNLALGERRAMSVRNYLEINGAQRSQIEVVSFGEEFPADPGRNEAAWAQNRRVVIEY